MKKRVDKLIKEFSNYEINAIVSYNGLNRQYLSGFTGSSGYLYISENKKVLLTDFRYIEQGSKECEDFVVVDYTKNGLTNTLNELIEEDNISLLGFEPSTVSYVEYKELKDNLKNVKLVETKNIVEKIRMIKDEEELENIKKAASIADLAFDYILNYIKPGITEKEIAFELEFFMKKNGANNLSFDTIVASGINGSLPHATPSDKLINSGDMVTMDFGCIYNGYCSDMTRTIVVGKASDKQKEVYNTVLKAGEEALKILKAGLTGKEVDKVARDIIDNAGYKDNFGHGLGHSLGLFVHEEPRVSPKSNNILQENMVVTIEPGIYIPNFGGVRIEDLVCVKKEGIINFTSSPKQLIEL